MPLSPQQRRRFLTRTRNIYRHQREHARAAGVVLDYTLEELRRLVLVALGLPCPYCPERLTVARLSVDHRRPTCRGGHHARGNLAVCCLRCNQVKGRLTDGEFLQLLAVTWAWEPEAAADLLARLRAGGRRYRGRGA